MRLPPAPNAMPNPLPGVLWELRSFHLQQRVERNSRWWFENRSRTPRGTVIFQYSVRGKMCYRERSGEWEVGPGHAALFAYGEESAYGLPASYREPYLTQYLSLRGAGLLEHCNFIRRRFGSVFYLGADNPLHEAIRQLCAQSPSRNAAQAVVHATSIHGFLMRLYTFLERQWAREKPPVERAIDELLRHSTGAWSMKEVAQRHGCSREHLTRAFRAKTGTPPARFLARAKLEKAQELLRETSLPLALVAQQSGFASTFTLARRIRQATGLPPGALRLRAQGE